MSLDEIRPTSSPTDIFSRLEPTDPSMATAFPYDATRAIAFAVDESPHKSRLMAVLGHDLRQPLQVIAFILELLGSKMLDSELRSRLELAQTAVQRIGEGLDSLVLASREDHFPDLPAQRIFPIAAILGQIETTWSEHAAHGNVRLNVVNDSSYVVSDIDMLTTILGNLIGNAIKYAPGREVFVRCQRVKSTLSICVIDTGPGIAPERIEAIFRPFHQEDATAPGYGLGLSIAQRTAAVLGHRIRVQSALGKGCTFSVDVPLVLDAAVIS